MSLLVVTFFAVVFMPSMTLGQITDPPEEPTDEIPGHCLQLLKDCASSCSECSSCYEIFLHCVSEFPVSADEENMSDYQYTDTYFNEEEEKEGNPEAPDIPQVCLDKFTKCMTGNCSECVICYDFLLDCYENSSLSDDIMMDLAYDHSEVDEPDTIGFFYGFYELDDEQPATELDDEQPATELNDEQPATELNDEQPATELNDEQPATELNDEQPATELNDEQPATELNDEQPATGLNDEQPATESYPSSGAVNSLAEDEQSSSEEFDLARVSVLPEKKTSHYRECVKKLDECHKGCPECTTCITEFKKCSGISKVWKVGSTKPSY